MQSMRLQRRLNISTLWLRTVRLECLYCRQHLCCSHYRCKYNNASCLRILFHCPIGNHVQFLWLVRRENSFSINHQIIMMKEKEKKKTNILPVFLMKHWSSSWNNWHVTGFSAIDLLQFEFKSPVQMWHARRFPGKICNNHKWHFSVNHEDLQSKMNLNYLHQYCMQHFH